MNRSQEEQQGVPSRTAKLVVLSGPSGVGKTTVAERLLRESPVPLVKSVSATTRPPRPGEVHGVDYFFLTPDEFFRRREAGEFLETAEVFGNGIWYGTLRDSVVRLLQDGKWVLSVIDVQGAIAVRKALPDAVSIFLLPENPTVLLERLRGRGTEDEETVRLRLQRAEEELRLADHYRYRVINDRVEDTVARICGILAFEAGLTGTYDQKGIVADGGSSHVR
ncbi:guanylate kinase [Thermopirellula anaerolimosa]